MGKFTKLRVLILAGYLLPILLSFGSSIIVSIKLTSLKEMTDRLNSSRDVAEQMGRLSFNISRLSKEVRGYLLEKNEETAENFDRAWQNFQETSAALNNLIEDPEQQANFAELLAKVDELHDLDAQLINLVNNDERSLAIETWKIGKGREFADEIAALLETIRNRDEEIVKEKVEEQKEALDNLRIVVWSSTGFSLLAALTIGFWIVSIIVSKINMQATAIATAANEIATTVEEQERVAMQQATSVNQTTTSMDELGTSSQQSAEQAQAASEAANRVLILASNKTLTQEEIVSNKISLKEQMKEVQRQIQRLSEHLKQISSITNAASDLANQTNMLALNASVEAVRAGEHGKGFGVVAAEIRKLADRSRQSAEKISALIIDIQNATNSTVAVTEEGTKAVENIVEAINDVALNIQQISLNAKQQAIAIQQVVDAMNSLNIAAQESATGIAQTKTSTQQLNQTAGNLQSMI
ncbi:MAG: chemotaxis protein [Okeania sp. SIO2H7]|nr:chemotaxis protein [Okeania sp. SIO2H7]